MASITFKNVVKRYDNNVTVVPDLNLEIKDKEFIVLVGPSGCGKSTTLRMIAGLEDVTEGDLFIGDRRVNDVAPKDRDIAMVFQSYALYPHMTVYKNMAFALELRKVPKDEIDRKVHEAAKILELEEYLDRKPKALSGGQRQRVALGRAMVRDPKVFLLDEPLSNLDAKLRESMRFEIKEIQKEYGITVVYVTHDQTEAMAMSDRIVVINRGVIQQIGSPREIYTAPANPFVADFVGKIEFLEGEVRDGAIELTGCGQRLPYKGPLTGSVIVGIRPEQVQYAAAGEGELTGTVRTHFYLGDVDDCRVDLGEGKELRVIADPYMSMGVAAGKQVTLKVRSFHVFPKDEAGDFRKILT